jgi:uncharacterized protein YndB with AHSA1/START domain
MDNNNKTHIEKNLSEKSILVSREFSAPVSEVWRAHTEKELLDQWWGPAPWKAETKMMNFKPGGHWIYAMSGPENQKHWARMDYKTIEPNKRIEIEDSFSDENGNVNTSLPVSKGNITFSETTNGTKVEFKMHYATEEEVKKITEMGFEEGISTSYDQLEDLLKKEVV